MSKIFSRRSSALDQFYSATVIRKLSTGQLVFHKYRRVSKRPVQLERFFQAMKRMDVPDGRALYVNLYHADTRTFSHRHTFE